MANNVMMHLFLYIYCYWSQSGIKRFANQNHTLTTKNSGKEDKNVYKRNIIICTSVFLFSYIFSLLFLISSLKAF